MAGTIKIAGVDITAKCSNGRASFSQPVRGQRGTSSLRIEVLPSETPYVPAMGAEVEFYDGSTRSFLGTIDTITTTPVIPSGGGFFYDLSVVSFEQRIDKRTVTRTFPAGTTCGAIVSSILGTELAGEGIGAGTISSGATVPTSQVYDHARISDVFTSLAALAEINPLLPAFVWYVNPADACLYFTTPAAVSAPFTVVDSKVLASGASAQQTRTSYRNRQHVKIGENTLTPVREQFAGDGSTDSFTLSKSIREIVSISKTTAVAATSTGTFTGNPSPGDYIIVGEHVYIFKASTADPFNTGDASLNFAFTFTVYVLIGATAADTASNLAAAVTRGAGTGTLYSTYASADSVASLAAVGTTVTATGIPGQDSNGLNLQSSSSAFSWAGAASGGEAGGVTAQSFVEASTSASGSYQWTYTSGGTTVSQTAGQTPPASGETLWIEYKPVGFGIITVDNPVEIAIRAAAEGGSGIYENLALRTDILTTDAGVAVAQTLLANNDEIVDTVTFQTDYAGLMPGMYTPINDTALGVNDNFLITQVVGALMRQAGLDVLRYTITAVNNNQPQTAVGMFAALVNVASPSGGSSNHTPAVAKDPGNASATGPLELNFGVDDDTVGTNVTGKYAPVKNDGVPFEGILTVKRLAPYGSADSIFDIKYSADGGATWTSIFPSGITPLGGGIVIPAELGGTGNQDVNFASNPRVRLITSFKGDTLVKGGLMRLDSLQAGGATDIEIYIHGEASGQSGQVLNFSSSGNAMLAVI